MAATPQDVWLRALDEADAYKRWVFGAIASDIGRDVLEIGCGIGTYTGMIAAGGARVMAIEIDGASAAAARRRFAGRPEIEIFAGDAREAPQRRAHDTVVALDVIEHVEDDAGLVRHLAAQLATGGRMIVKVPAHGWLFGSLDRAIGHHRRYSRGSITALLSDAGLSVERVTAFNLVGIAGWWLNGRWLARSAPPAGQVRWFERLMPLVRLIDRINPTPLGLSLIAIARKP